MDNLINRKIDYTLYLVTDRNLMSTNNLETAVENAINGGVTMVQIREKSASSLEFYEQAFRIKKLTGRYSIPLVVNDRIDIALAIGADGIHIGQNDIPASVARKIIGKNMLLGVSASSVKEALQAQNDGADYLGIGAMFSTGTKTDAKTVSIEELQHIRKAVSIPIVAIGGISKENAAIFQGMGVDGLAVVSAIIAQPDIKAAAEELKFLFRKGESVK
jgi:thiamine-phosphate pyrophosphorylase